MFIHYNCHLYQTRRLTKSMFVMVLDNLCATTELENISATNTPRPYDEDFDLLSSLHNHTSYQVAMAINLYCIPIILVFGFIGNTFSILVSLQMHNRCIPFCVFMTGLAIVDNSMLLIAGHLWITLSIQIRAPIDLECHVLAWLFQWLSCYGIYVIVLMTFDRCIAVCYPYIAVRWRTYKKAVCVVIFIGIILLIFTFPTYFMSEINGQLCVAIGSTGTGTKVYVVVTSLVLCIFPFGSILTMNIMIIKALRKRAGFLNSVSYNSQKDNNKVRTGTKNDSQLSAMLLLVSFALLMLTLPQYIRYGFFLFYPTSINDASGQAFYILLYHISQKMYLANNACNFYLYNLGSVTYRKDCAKLCRSITCHRHKKDSSVKSMDFKSCDLKSIGESAFDL